MKTLRLFALFFLSLILSGCASGPAPRGILQYELAEFAREQQVFFPPPPEAPRLMYGGELIGERNFVSEKKGKSFGQKLLDVLTGVSITQSELQLTRPQMVVTDSADRVIVSDAGIAALVVFDPVEGRLRIIRRGFPTGNFTSLSGIAVAPDDSLFVADPEAGLVSHLDTHGNVFAPIGEGILKRPTGLVFDSAQQRLIVTDTHESNLKVFDLQGRLLQTIGGPGSDLGEFNRPTHLAIWRNELYVADTLNARVQVLNLDDGQPIRAIGTRGTYIGQLSTPKGVALDSDGNLYVIESLNDHLLIFDRSGRFLLPIGGAGYGPGKFYLPAGIFIDSGNRVYVADMYNGRIVTFLYLNSESESDD